MTVPPRNRHARLADAFLCLALLAAPVGGAAAAPTACPEQFAGGEAPDAVAPAPAARTQELCFLQFAVLHSNATRTPLWSAEHLTRDRVETASRQRRINAFHAEDRLPVEDRAELADYRNAEGRDRGHMAPSGDMPDPESQRESFTLANMIPQDSNNNRGVWARLESGVRSLAQSDGDIYVVTGPIFPSENVQRLNDRVMVPSRIFKAVYDPAQHAAGAYLTDNARGSAWQVVSLAELKNLIGFDVFPSLDQEVKDHAMALPSPEHRTRPRGKPPAAGDGRGPEAQWGNDDVR